MKKKQYQELKNKSAEELEKMAADLRKKRQQVQMDLASGKEKDLKAVKKIKRDIAQILTMQGIIASQQAKGGKEE